ncbi:MAG: DUF6635 family protein, partial [Gammaproteobacteria bacterium]
TGTAAIDEYFAACRAQIPGFVQAHFSLRGALRIHRRALGLDLIIAPVNVLLALPAVLIRLLALAIRRMRRPGAARALERLPLGFQTSVERAVIRALGAEILGLARTRPPFELTWAGADCAAALAGTQFALRLEPSLVRYAAARRAAAEITAALLAGFAGLFFLDRFSPGSVSAGRALADALGRETAVRDFWLGDTLGGWYYGVFAPETPLLLTLGVIVLLMVVLSLCAAFAGLLADPLQRALGLHRRRLRRLLRSLEACAHERTSADFDPKDHYVARATDVIDVLRGLWPG